MRLRHAVDATGMPVTEAVQQFGSACGINGTLPGAVYTAINAQGNFETALIETVMAGGDSTARGMAVGMLLGAYHGAGKIPGRWLKSLNCYTGLTQILAATE